MEADGNFLHLFLFHFMTYNKRQRPAVWLLLRIEAPTLFSSHTLDVFYSLVFHSFHFSATMLLDQNIIWRLRLACRSGREKESFTLHTAEGCRSTQPRKWHQLKATVENFFFFLSSILSFFFSSSSSQREATEWGTLPCTQKVAGGRRRQLRANLNSLSANALLLPVARWASEKFEERTDKWMSKSASRHNEWLWGRGDEWCRESKWAVASVGD